MINRPTTITSPGLQAATQPNVTQPGVHTAIQNGAANIGQTATDVQNTGLAGAQAISAINASGAANSAFAGLGGLASLGGDLLNGVVSSTGNNLGQFAQEDAANNANNIANSAVSSAASRALQNAYTKEKHTTAEGKMLAHAANNTLDVAEAFKK